MSRLASLTAQAHRATELYVVGASFLGTGAACATYAALRWTSGDVVNPDGSPIAGSPVAVRRASSARRSAWCRRTREAAGR